MDEPIYDSMYLHKSLALCVLGMGMATIAMLYLAELGALQMLATGMILGLWGACRLHYYTRAEQNQKK